MSIILNGDSLVKAGGGRLFKARAQYDYTYRRRWYPPRRKVASFARADQLDNRLTSVLLVANIRLKVNALMINGVIVSTSLKFFILAG